MKMKRLIITALLAVSVAVSVSGCLSITADELYSLPEVAEEYRKLQAQINMLLSRNAVLAAPTRGPNRQAVQLRDINGNGINEVFAFFSFPGESKLMIYVFEMVGDDYIHADIIESAGTEIESVRYIDMDNDGTMELIVGWQMGTTLKYMSIYSLKDFHIQLLVSGEEFTEITSLAASDESGDDVVVLKLPTQEAGNPIAKVYSLMPDGEIVTQETRLSAGIETIARILNGRLVDDEPALFVESDGRYDDGSLVTDILSRQDTVFANITISPTIGVSIDTVRHRMNSSDINKDGVIMVPTLRRLKAQSETEYYAIDWYSYRSSGSRTLSLTTYHNTFDEWYLILPRDWREKVSVRREEYVPGERTIIFSYFDNPESEKYEDFLKIYRLTGENAEERAQQDGRILLLTEGSISYAFELLKPDNSFGLTFSEEMVKENFRLIRTEWQPR